MNECCTQYEPTKGSSVQRRCNKQKSLTNTRTILTLRRHWHKPSDQFHSGPPPPKNTCNPRRGWPLTCQSRHNQCVHGAMFYCLVKVSSANKHGILTQNIGRSVSGNETRVVPIAHPFLQYASAEILSKTAARCHQTVVAAVCLRKSADDSSGNQSTVRQHGQHHLRHQLPPKKPAKLAVLLAQRRREHTIILTCWLASLLTRLEMCGWATQT